MSAIVGVCSLSLYWFRLHTKVSYNTEIPHNFRLRVLFQLPRNVNFLFLFRARRVYNTDLLGLHRPCNFLHHLCWCSLSRIVNSICSLVGVFETDVLLQLGTLRTSWLAKIFFTLATKLTGWLPRSVSFLPVNNAFSGNPNDFRAKRIQCYEWCSVDFFHLS